jgi:hypothetical protein
MANYTTAHFRKNKKITEQQIEQTLLDAIKWKEITLKDSGVGVWEIQYNGEYAGRISFGNNELTWPHRGEMIIEWLLGYIGEYTAEKMGAYKMTDEGVDDVWKPKFHNEYPVYSKYYNMMHSFIIKKRPFLKFMFIPEKEYVKIFG